VFSLDNAKLLSTGKEVVLKKFSIKARVLIYIGRKTYHAKFCLCMFLFFHCFVKYPAAQFSDSG